MLKEDIDFLCVFDASARPILREFQGAYFAELCDELIRTFWRRFGEVPARTVADEAILDIATIFGTKIITNDQYREYDERYPWLEASRDERLCGLHVRHNAKRREDLLVWQGTTIPVPLAQNLQPFVEQYKKLLVERESNAKS